VELPEGEYDTVGGMLMSVLGTIPMVGESAAINGTVFTIKNMDGSRVDIVTVTLHKGE